MDCNRLLNNDDLTENNSARFEEIKWIPSLRFIKKFTMFGICNKGKNAKLNASNKVQQF